MKWNPSKYAEFGNHRDRPFHDLVARIQAAEPGLVVDLGCGPGNMTATLADRWPAAHVVGIDSSQEMLAKAEPLTGQFSGLEFMQGDIAEWTPMWTLW